VLPERYIVRSAALMLRVCVGDALCMSMHICMTVTAYKCDILSIAALQHQLSSSSIIVIVIVVTPFEQHLTCKCALRALFYLYKRKEHRQP
jgi:hypothetical protein